MSNTNTKIEWTNVTWSPVTGCQKVSDGCKNCYAERVFDRMAQNPKTPAYHGRKFTDVVCHEDKLAEPLHWKKPRKVFVNSMSDLFHEDVPFEFIVRVFSAMAITPRHTYQILTKRPERMLKFFQHIADMDESPGDVLASNAHCDFGEESDCWIGNYVNGWSMPKEIPNDGNPCNGTVQRWPLPNVWLGVSVEDQNTADARIPALLQTPAAIRFVSYEPALGPVDLTDVDGNDVMSPNNDPFWEGVGKPSHLDWVIAGGESGPNARPSHPDWFRAVRDQCVQAGVPFFFKQWGKWVCPSQMTGETYRKIQDFGDGIGITNNPRGVGKKRAGRLLDGREWNEFPAIERMKREVRNEKN